MSNKVNLTVRTEPEIKAQADDIYKSMGMSLSTAINMFLVATVRCGGLPLELPKSEKPLGIEKAPIEK